MCTLFLPQAYFAFSEEVSLRRAQVARETEKLGGSDLYTGCLLLAFIAIHEKNTPKYMETGFISCTGQQGEGMHKLS